MPLLSCLCHDSGIWAALGICMYTSHVTHFYCQSFLASRLFPAPPLHDCSYRCLSSRHRKPTYVCSRASVWQHVWFYGFCWSLMRPLGSCPELVLIQNRLPHKAATYEMQPLWSSRPTLSLSPLMAHLRCVSFKKYYSQLCWQAS